MEAIQCRPDRGESAVLRHRRSTRIGPGWAFGDCRKPPDTCADGLSSPSPVARIQHKPAESNPRPWEPLPDSATFRGRITVRLAKKRGLKSPPFANEPYRNLYLVASFLGFFASSSWAFNRSARAFWATRSACRINSFFAFSFFSNLAFSLHSRFWYSMASK